MNSDAWVLVCVVAFILAVMTPLTYIYLKMSKEEDAIRRRELEAIKEITRSAEEDIVAPVTAGRYISFKKGG